MKPLLLALLTVGALAACDATTTAPKAAPSIHKDIVCRSGYIVTSGDKCPDSTQT